MQDSPESATLAVTIIPVSPGSGVAARAVVDPSGGSNVSVPLTRSAQTEARQPRRRCRTDKNRDAETANESQGARYLINGAQRVPQHTVHQQTPTWGEQRSAAPGMYPAHTRVH